MANQLKSDESSSDDEDENKEDDKKEQDKDGQADKDKDKTKAGSSKSSATGQGKHKQGDASKKGNTLKRAGSPALSESSGNESSRKKLKKSAAAPTGSRSGTPLPQTAVPRRSKMGAGSGSDGEGTAGEMSDGAGPRKKIKLIGSGGKGTPSGSRAGSPIPTQGSKYPCSISSLSPQLEERHCWFIANTFITGASPPQSGMGIDPSEILEKIPPEGIAIGDLIKPFHGRVGDKPGQMPKQEWIRLVKQLCDYGPDKRLRRRK